MAAIVTISEDGKQPPSIRQQDFLDFIGGARKFSIRYDESSKRYWTIANMITKEFASLPAGKVRNTLVLKSSADLKNWIVEKYCSTIPYVLKHGFQYVDWQFDRKDIIFLSRTAYDDDLGGADNFHNANYLTFHRIKNFEKFFIKIKIIAQDHLFSNWLI